MHVSTLRAHCDIIDPQSWIFYVIDYGIRDRIKELIEVLKLVLLR